MFYYLLRQLTLLVLTLLALCLVSFLLAHLFPGDLLANLSGVQTSRLTPLQLTELSREYRLDHNVIWQFGAYLQHIFSGHWGVSFSSGQSLFAAVKETLPASIELSFYTFALSLLLGIPLGLFAGLKHKKTADYSLLSLSVFCYSMPVFWLALLGIMIFCLQLGWLPLSGRIGLLYEVPHYSGFILVDILLSNLPNKTAALQDALIHMILPTFSVTVVTFSVFLRIVRRSTLETMPKTYVKAALTRGLTHRQVFLRHGIRNSLLPVMPLLVPQFAALLTNCMIVEIIFSWPGIGNWLIQAIAQQDYPAIRIGMLVVAALVIVFTISTEVAIHFLDPTQSKKRRAII